MHKTTTRKRALTSLGAALAAALAFSGPVLGETKLAKIIEVQPREGSLDRTFFGRVKARETVDFAFQVGGQIIEFPLDEGQPIRKGQLLAELDLEPFELTLARAEEELDAAIDDFERLSSLTGSVVSQTSIDDAETAAEISEIELRDAQRSLRLATLKAPFDGIVASKAVPNFSTITAGTPVVRLHDMSDLRIEIEVPEVLFQRAGRDPNVKLEAEFPASSTRYELEFREVTAETSDIGQAFQLTLGMLPTDELFVLPGSSVTVYASLEDADAALIVPSAALVFDPDGNSSVMVFEPTGAEEGTITRTPVEVAPDVFGSVQVTSGLAAGMEIISAGAALLNDGDTVQRFTGFTR